MPEAFVARQPIFNRKLEVVGYELLFRGGYVHEGAISDPERATATVLLNLLTELDVGKVVGHKRAWVNVPGEFILSGLAEAIPPSLVGFDVQEGDLADERMPERLRELRTAGYHLALDDFQGRAGSLAVVKSFEVVKLNMVKLGRRRLADNIQLLRRYQGTLLAQGLETREAHEFCETAGCDFFQGYFFCQPSVLATRRISANRLALLRVIAAMHQQGVQLSELQELIAHDVALSYRLLRYVNSAYFGLRGEVRSIGQALALLGVENVRRWATLTIMATVDDKPTELTLTALIRARFCELAGAHLGITSAPELFTLGLFSVLDAMMDAPMQDVVASLPLADDVRDALSFRKGERGRLLDCVVALELGNHDQAQAIVARAGELYLDAIMWANSVADALLGAPAEDKAEPEPVPAAAPPAPAPVVVEPSRSKPPPGMEARTAPAKTATVTDLDAHRRQQEAPKGAFRRLLTRLRAWLRYEPRRRQVDASPAGESSDERRAA
jgi:EAL and modified HD-GYP domain-containing signal transduction protein